MANAFSQFGLAMKGANEAQSDALKLQQEQQQLDAGQQQEQLRQQQITSQGLTGQNQQQDFQDKQALRTFLGAGGTEEPKGSFKDAADFAAGKLGRPDLAGPLYTAYDNLQKMGASRLVDAVRQNDQSGNRPDLLPLLTHIDKYKDAKSVTHDGAGTLTVTKADGSTEPISVHRLGIYTGQFQPYVKEVTGGSSLVGGQVGDTLRGAPAPTVTSAPMPTKFQASRAGGVFQSEGPGATGQPTYVPPQPSKWTNTKYKLGDQDIIIQSDSSTGEGRVVAQAGSAGKGDSVKIVTQPGSDNSYMIKGGQAYQIVPGTGDEPPKLQPISEIPQAEQPPVPGAQPMLDPKTKQPIWALKDPKTGKWMVKPRSGATPAAKTSAASGPIQRGAATITNPAVSQVANPFTQPGPGMARGGRVTRQQSNGIGHA